jgi:magnesium transporter
MVTLIYEENGTAVRSSDAGQLQALMGEAGRTFWLDLETPAPEELRLLEEVFHFHPIAVEDASRARQRPKLDEYDGYFFLTADEVILDASAYDEGRGDRAAEALQQRQLAAFLGPHYLVTVQTEPLEAVRAIRDRCSDHPRVLERGADFLLYVVLDTLVDHYFPMMDALDERIDALEDRIVDRPEQTILDTIFAMKRGLTRVRKLVGPLREVVQSLTTRDVPNIRPEMLPYFRDVADHLFRIYETLDGYRDLMSNMLDAYLSQVSNEMNRVMQRLSVVSTVFLPITFLTGVFGMNFDRQPWVHTSVWFWLAVMAVMAGCTVWWFHRRRLV